MKGLFTSFRQGIVLVYKMMNCKVPMWVCWILCLVTVPINLVIMLISYLVTENLVPEYVNTMKKELED